MNITKRDKKLILKFMSEDDEYNFQRMHSPDFWDWNFAMECINLIEITVKNTFVIGGHVISLSFWYSKTKKVKLGSYNNSWYEPRGQFDCIGGKLIDMNCYFSNDKKDFKFKIKEGEYEKTKLEACWNVCLRAIKWHNKTFK